MIKLEVEYYCQCNCPYFEVVVQKSNSKEDTYITCKNKSMCRDLYKRFAAIDKAASINPDSCENDA